MFELGIDDLGEVLGILRKHSFNSTDYFDLGLDLGLLYRTIDAITSDYRGISNHCLRECLVKWLEKADKVKEKGGSYLVCTDPGFKINKSGCSS